MASEQIAALDASSLMALRVPEAGRILVVGAPGPLDARLGARGCDVRRVDSVEKGQADFGRGEFDAVLFAEGFEYLGDPVSALRTAAELVVEQGTVLFAAPNAASVRARVASFLGETSTHSGVPPRHYDLAALENVAALAGLTVVDRLRVFGDADLSSDALPASLLERAQASEDARTDAFVVVAGTGALSTPTRPTLAESLQAQVDAASARLLAAVAEAAEVQADRERVNVRLQEIEAELVAARAQVEDHERELETRASAILDRIDTIDRLHTERRHLELDVAVKNDYIADLRTELNTWKAAYSELKLDYDNLLRSRHYRVAAGLHRVLRQIPFAHGIATRLTRLLAKSMRPATPPSS